VSRAETAVELLHGAVMTDSNETGAH
jgi:hypothetical protein